MASSVSQGYGTTENDIHVFGVDLALDEAIVDAIVAEHDKHSSPKEIDEDEEIPIAVGTIVYWSLLLHTVLWVYCATPHSVTGMSPALLALGRELRLPVDRPLVKVSQSKDGYKEAIIERLKWVVDTVPGLKEVQHPIKDTKLSHTFQLG